MTAVGINSSWIKPEENPPFTKDLSASGCFSSCGGRLSNLSEAHRSSVVALVSLPLDSNKIPAPCPSKCLPIPRNLQEPAFISCRRSTVTFTRKFFCISFYFCGFYIFLVFLFCCLNEKKKILGQFLFVKVECVRQ